MSRDENVCRQIFDEAVRKYGPFWHLCTPGEAQQVIFVTREDFEFGMLLMAMCAFDCPNVKIITFELMANHIHAVLAGLKEDCEAFFALFKKRLHRYLKLIKSGVSLVHFDADLKLIDTIESLRNRIVYVNRNNFLIDSGQTPWTYPYGANGFYYMDIVKMQCDCRFRDLTMRERKALTHTHECRYPDDAIIIGRYISPVSFCDIALGESIFRDARHYFHKVSRDVEGYKDIAAELGDKVFCTYEELESAVYGICNRKYDGARPNLLSPSAKIELARIMHYDYRADNKAVSKILGLDVRIMNDMFH